MESVFCLDREQRGQGWPLSPDLFQLVKVRGGSAPNDQVDTTPVFPRGGVAALTVVRRCVSKSTWTIPNRFL